MKENVQEDTLVNIYVGVLIMVPSVNHEILVVSFGLFFMKLSRIFLKHQLDYLCFAFLS